MSCIFCQIVAGTVESSVVSEAKDTLAFLDIHQFNPGHCLVIPKRHCENIWDVPAGQLEAVILATKEVAGLLRQNFGAGSLSIWQANGAAAGQDVWHLHFHVMPRTDLRELQFYADRELASTERNDLDEIARKIRGEK